MAALEQAPNTEPEPTPGDEPGIDIEALNTEHSKDMDRERNKTGAANKRVGELETQLAELQDAAKKRETEGQSAEEQASAAAEERISSLEKQIESLTAAGTASQAETVAGRRKMALSAAGVTAENSATMARLLEGSTDEELTAEVEALKTSFPAAFTEPDAPAPRGASSPPGRPGVIPKPEGSSAQAVQDRLKEIRENKDLTPSERRRQRNEANDTILAE